MLSCEEGIPRYILARKIVSCRLRVLVELDLRGFCLYKMQRGLWAELRGRISGSMYKFAKDFEL